MKFHILTLFPEMVMGGLNTSIIGRAVEKGILSINAVNIRDYSKDKHRHVDDYPYGGGAGMVMQPGPIYDAYMDLCRQSEMEEAENAETAKVEEAASESAATEDRAETEGLKPENTEPKTVESKRRPRVIYMTPQGRVFNQEMAKEFAKEDELVFLCGHYEGVDERVLELIATDYVSMGDYVLTGGELPAMVMIDCISRLVPGVLNNEESAEFESFHDNLLEYPQYTRPETFMDKKVPEVLLSGHHAKIERWRRDQSLLRTWERRPDLLEQAALDKKDKKFLRALEEERAMAEKTER